MRVAIVSLALLMSCGLAVAQGGQKICDAKKYGAVGDGKTLDTVAIQKAIDDCAVKGAIVRLAGAAKFISAPLVLKSHTTLEIASGTTLEGSTNHADYPEIEQFHDKGRQSLISAVNV
jgi:polygalacturonase